MPLLHFLRPIRRLPSLLCLSGLIALAGCAHRPAPAPAMPAGCRAPQVYPAVPGYTPIYADRGSGGAFSEVDAQAYAGMQRAMAGFWQDLRSWFKMSDALARSADPAAAACPLAWLDAWAQGGHMLQAPGGSQPEQYQSRYEMKWALQGLVTAYALNLQPYADAAQRARIEAWLKLAGREVAAFNIERPGEGKLNNHYYWGGASVMAVALATGDRNLLALARHTYEAGIDEIGEDGSLPREMRRKQQSLHYHNFSLTPLVFMAELARQFGEDWYAYKPGRLERLRGLILHALDDPQFAQQYFGVAQDAQLMTPCSEDWGWTYFAPDSLSPRLARLRPAVGRCRSRLLGGDIALLKEKGLFAARKPLVR